MAEAAKKPFRSPGTSFTATRARSPGGWPAPGRSRRSSRSRAAAWCRRRSSRASSSCGSSRRCASPPTTTTRTRAACKVLKTIAAEVAKFGGGAKILIVDDLVDTGATAKVVREMLPKAHFATVYAKPLGRPLVDTFVTEVSPGHLDLFPLGHGPRLPAADRQGRRGLKRGFNSARKCETRAAMRTWRNW